MAQNLKGVREGYTVKIKSSSYSSTLQRLPLLTVSFVTYQRWFLNSEFIVEVRGYADREITI